MNIRERSQFVVHIAHREMAKALTESSATLPAGDSELDRLDLPTTRFEGFRLPRLAACRVAYACDRYEIRELGPRRQALILGLVTRMFLDDGVVTGAVGGDIEVSAAGIDPVGRLGASEYVTFGDIVNIPRPK